MKKLHRKTLSPFHTRGSYYWIILSKTLVHAITERDVCTKFEKNWSQFATSKTQIHKKKVNLYSTRNLGTKIMVI